MKQKLFICTLLSDVIINQAAGTEGNQSSLDFIPGSNFLGVSASTLYDDNQLSSLDKKTIFYSGCIRYGDAHPAILGSRSLKTPLSFFLPKNQSQPLYLHHFVDPSKVKAQLKQCREGYILPKDDGVLMIKTKKNFAIKSAYDREKRRSMDEQMFGYESMKKGGVYMFEVTFDDSVSEILVNKVVKSLLGIKRVGRSKTAQYGLVEIKESASLASIYHKKQISEKDYVLLYAESRLIFADADGLPTFTPSAEDFGLEGGTILWDRCQIRTFQYAPWNNKRRTRDADRCGIEKGSVFVIRPKKMVPEQFLYVGLYQSEGFGKVCINPDFLLEANPDGISEKRLTELNLEDIVTSGDSNNKESKLNTNDQKLYDLVYKNHQKEALQYEILTYVNDYTEKNEALFKGNSFASQWGSIRKIALANSGNRIKDLLFKEKTGYLMHGVAADKWDAKRRRSTLEDFIVKIEKFGDEAIQYAVINLSSEMAKLCRRN